MIDIREHGGAYASGKYKKGTFLRFQDVPDLASLFALPTFKQIYTAAFNQCYALESDIPGTSYLFGSDTRPGVLIHNSGTTSNIINFTAYSGYSFFVTNFKDSVKCYTGRAASQGNSSGTLREVWNSYKAATSIATTSFNTAYDSDTDIHKYAIDKDGNFYNAPFRSNIISKYSSSGTLIWQRDPGVYGGYNPESSYTNMGVRIIVDYTTGASIVVGRLYPAYSNLYGYRVLYLKPDGAVGSQSIHPASLPNMLNTDQVVMDNGILYSVQWDGNSTYTLYKYDVSNYAHTVSNFPIISYTKIPSTYMSGGVVNIDVSRRRIYVARAIYDLDTMNLISSSTDIMNFITRGVNDLDTTKHTYNNNGFMTYGYYLP